MITGAHFFEDWELVAILMQLFPLNKKDEILNKLFEIRGMIYLRNYVFKQEILRS